MNKEVLDFFWVASGHEVNSSKTEVYFSKNTNLGDAIEICSMQPKFVVLLHLLKRKIWEPTWGCHYFIVG